EIAAAAEDLEPRADLGTVRRVPRDGAQVAQVVAVDAHRLAGLELLHLRRAVGAAGEAKGQQHDRRMDDVAAVAAPVTADERREGAEPGRVAERLASTGAADALQDEHA